MNNQNFGLYGGEGAQGSAPVQGPAPTHQTQTGQRPPQWNSQSQQNSFNPQQRYNTIGSPQDYFIPPQPAVYAPPQFQYNNYATCAPPQPQYNNFAANIPSPELKLLIQKNKEQRIVRKLGNRAGWAAFTVHMAMTILVVALVMMLLPSQTSPQYENVAALTNSIGAMLAMFCSGFMLLGLTHTRLRDVVTFRRTKSLKRCTAAFFVGLGAIPVCNLLAQLVANNLTLIGIENKSYQMSGLNTEVDFFYISVQILCTAIVPAISEEFFFRGALLGAMKPYGQGFAIVMSSVIFGLIHGNLGQIPFAIAGGMFFAFLTVYSGSLIPSIILHCINNLLSVVLDIMLKVCDENVVYAVMIAYYIIFTIVAVVAFAMLSKRDKSFMKLERPESKINDGEKSLAFIVSPGMIVFIIIMVLETAASYFTV